MFIQQDVVRLHIPVGETGTKRDKERQREDSERSPNAMHLINVTHTKCNPAQVLFKSFSPQYARVWVSVYPCVFDSTCASLQTSKQAECMWYLCLLCIQHNMHVKQKCLCVCMYTPVFLHIAHPHQPAWPINIAHTAFLMMQPGVIVCE